MTQVFDYIVVGTGAAGSVMTNRLSELDSVTVLALEAGQSEIPEDVIIPYRWPRLFGSEIDWGHKSVPQPALGNRQISEISGKVAGGSSNFYHMVHVRGHRADYDNWAYNGCPGWGWADVLPYFQKLENHTDGADASGGRGGPLDLIDAGEHEPNPASSRFLEACAELGYDRIDDINGASMWGAGWHHLNIREGRRFGALAAYLEPALQRPNVTLSSRSTVTRLLFQGSRCTGVEYVHDGQLKQASAANEVIVCGGAIQSPKLLMLSGMGAAAQLQPLGIPVLVDLAGVGEIITTTSWWSDRSSRVVRRFRILASTSPSVPCSASPIRGWSRRTCRSASSIRRRMSCRAWTIGRS